MSDKQSLIRALEKQDLNQTVACFKEIKDKESIESAIHYLRLALMSVMVRDKEVVLWFEMVSNNLVQSVQSSLSYDLVKMLYGLGFSPSSSMSVGEDEVLQIEEKECKVLGNFLPPDMAGRILQFNTVDSAESLPEDTEKFLNNLVLIMKLRIKYLAMEYVPDYLEKVIEGIYAKLGIDLTERIISVIGSSFYEKLSESGSEPLPDQLPIHKLDILSALGFAKEAYFGEEYIEFTEKGHLVLSEVYNPFWDKTTLLEVPYPLNLI